MNMRKLITIVALLAVVMTAFALEVLYTNDSGADVLIEGRYVEDGDTVTFDHYVYNDNLTFTSVTGDPLILAHTEVSTTAAATTTVTVDELADVTINFDTDYPDEIKIYFNSSSTTPITLTADWEYDAHTMWFDRLIIVNTATTTSYSVLITRRF
jgi:hypothetical protein